MSPSCAVLDPVLRRRHRAPLPPPPPPPMLTAAATACRRRRLCLPQAAFLPNVNPANPGKTLRFRDNADTIARYADQFGPLRAFGCDLAAPFRGTLFRFPLRTPEQAAASRLSRAAHSVDR
jgi:hypothetical protein